MLLKMDELSPCRRPLSRRAASNRRHTFEAISQTSDCLPMADESDARPLPGSSGRITQTNTTVYSTPTDRDDEVYNLSHGQRLMVVFNHQSFERAGSPPSPRKGTDVDCRRLQDTFGALGFEVKIHHDLTVQQIRHEMANFSVEPAQLNIACLAIVVLTHGRQEAGRMRLEAQDREYSVDELIIAALWPDRSPALAGRPKLLLVQACQGVKTDSGIKLNPKIETDGSRARSEPPYRMASHSDLLILQSSYDGYFSFRGAQGTWLIQELCRALDESAVHEDFHSVLLRAKRYVSTGRLSHVPGSPLHERCQVPVVTDTLLRQLRLKADLFPDQTTSATSITSQVRLSQPAVSLEPLAAATGLPPAMKRTTWRKSLRKVFTRRGP